MAGPACHSEDGNQAVFIGTNLVTGDAQALCQECLPSFLVALLAAMTDTDPDKIAGVVYDDPTVAPGGAEAGRDEPPPPAPADDDQDAEADQEAEGEAASWVENGGPPPTAGKVAGRGSLKPSYGPADTGGSKAGDDE